MIDSNTARSSATNAPASARIARLALAGPAARCNAALSAFVKRNAKTIRSSFGTLSRFGFAALGGLLSIETALVAGVFLGAFPFALLVGVVRAFWVVVSLIGSSWRALVPRFVAAPSVHPMRGLIKVSRQLSSR